MSLGTFFICDNCGTQAQSTWPAAIAKLPEGWVAKRSRTRDGSAPWLTYCSTTCLVEPRKP